METTQAIHLPTLSFSVRKMIGVKHSARMFSGKVGPDVLSLIYFHMAGARTEIFLGPYWATHKHFVGYNIKRTVYAPVL